MRPVVGLSLPLKPDFQRIQVNLTPVDSFRFPKGAACAVKENYYRVQTLRQFVPEFLELFLLQESLAGGFSASMGK